MVKLKKVWKDKWIKALRSGKYQQGIGQLRERVVWDDTGENTHTEYCCLGVLCDLTGKKYRESEGGIPKNIFNLVTHKGSDYTKWYDEKGDDCKGIENKLIKMNDEQRKGFKAIADWIEKNL